VPLGDPPGALVPHGRQLLRRRPARLTQRLRQLIDRSRRHHPSARAVFDQLRRPRNLEEAVRKGEFRSDLYYRLNIFPITLPPLRERKEDIPILVTHLVRHLSQKLGKTIESIPQDTMAKLRNYPWPGNVRELRNVIERAVIISQGPKLRLLDDLDSQAVELDLQKQAVKQDVFADSGLAGETLEQYEYNLILRTLKNVHWKLEGPGGAAELLNLNPSTLRSKMRKLGIERPQYRAQP